MSPPLPDREVVTLTLAGHRFAVPVAEITEVFRPGEISPVPLAPPEIAGVLNLRGRILTLICARSRLGLPPRTADARPPIAIALERRGEPHGLLVDAVEEVLRLPGAAFEPSPEAVDARWAAVSSGAYRLERGLLPVLDLPRLLDLGATRAAA